MDPGTSKFRMFNRGCLSMKKKCLCMYCTGMFHYHHSIFNCESRKKLNICFDHRLLCQRVNIKIGNFEISSHSTTWLMACYVHNIKSCGYFSNCVLNFVCVDEFLRAGVSWGPSNLIYFWMGHAQPGFFCSTLRFYFNEYAFYFRMKISPDCCVLQMAFFGFFENHLEPFLSDKCIWQSRS